jgi:hypothetical protein
VIAVTVQNVFNLEMHQNKKKYFLKNIFDTNTSKRSKNIKKINSRNHVPKHTLNLIELIFYLIQLKPQPRI